MSKILVDACVFINAFKNDSEYRLQSIAFLEALAKSKQIITMPAHGWFEVWCNVKRIEKQDGTFHGVAINGEWNYPVELIHIDASFIQRYGNIELPYIKAGDHIYVVIAHVNHYPLVTTDIGMARTARQLDIEVYTPDEYLAAKFA